MSNNAMSNETGLDWLARNVHKWVPNELLRIKPCDNGNGTFRAGWCYSDEGGFTKDQWLSLRAELQNKPSWGSVGSDINFISQHDDGQWIGHSENPSEAGECFECNCVVSLFGYGEVLGDWRDTLEKRPEEFKPFTSIEDNQEQVMTQQQDMKQDNGWFERGDLPPVGKVCLYVVSDRLSAEVEITAHAKFGLCFVEVGRSGENYVSKTAGLHRFRPTPTERDVLIEIIKKTDDTDDRIADAILAAGFSLRGK